MTSFLKKHISKIPNQFDFWHEKILFFFPVKPVDSFLSENSLKTMA